MGNARWGAAAMTAALVAAGVGATGAHAAPSFHCEATALRASIAGQAPVEPVVTGRDGDCATAQGTPTLALPSLLSAQALNAATTFDGAGATGAAEGGIARLSVLPTPDFIAALPTSQAIDALPPLQVTLPPLGQVGLDIRDAVRALIPAPGAPLVSAELLQAQAAVSCLAGAAQLSGTSQVAGMRLAGQDVGAGSVADQVVPLINTQHIALSQLDISKIHVLGGFSPVAVAPLLAPVLAAVPPIDLPASVVSVTLTPGEQVRAGDTLTQRALHATVTLLGQPVLDAVFGEAKVSAAAGTCAPPPAAAAATPAAAAAKPVAAPVASQGSVAQQLLACSDRKLVLVDVLRRNGRVKLLGAAAPKYVGRRVAIRLRATGRVVAHAVVRKDGGFETTAPLPPRAMFATHRRANTVRYRAEIAAERSLPLKLERRMIVSSLSSAGGKVRITGRVVLPLTTPRAEIRLVRRVSCHHVVLVARFKPRADGRFSVTVKAPKGQAAAVYRMVTKVREKPSNPRSYPTFTLPRGVALTSR